MFMTKEEYYKIIAEMETLPTGNITYKKINGREYAYYQWRENGKQHTRRTKGEEFEQLSSQIERRKELQKSIKNGENANVINNFMTIFMEMYLIEFLFCTVLEEQEKQH